jgi:hypothetical protein
MREPRDKHTTKRRVQSRRLAGQCYKCYKNRRLQSHAARGHLRVTSVYSLVVFRCSGGTSSFTSSSKRGRTANGVTSIRWLRHARRGGERTFHSLRMPLVIPFDGIGTPGASSDTDLRLYRCIWEHQGISMAFSVAPQGTSYLQRDEERARGSHRIHRCTHTLVLSSSEWRLVSSASRASRLSCPRYRWQ